MRACLAALALVALLAGCGGGDDDEAATVPDGRHYGYIRELDADADPAEIVFDGAEFLTGKEASAAAVEDGKLPEGEPLANDYYVRNPSTASEALPVADGVTVTRVRCPGGCADGEPGDLAGLAESFARTGATLADDYRGAESQYWVTVRDGVVVAIDEQYLP